MAYASLVSLRHIMKLNLDPDQDPICPHKIKSLYKNIIFLIDFLVGYPQDAEALLEDRIRDAGNRAKHIIEHCDKCSDYTVLGGSTKYQIDKWRYLLIELQVVMEHVETLVEEVRQIKSRSTPVGLEENLLEIKGRLCEGTDKLRIIPIIGMAGVGKTTLARYAHNDPLSVDHFDLRAWVTVSQDYSTGKILLGILQSMTLSIEPIDKMSEEKLLEYLYKFLKGRRYLIVMDDVWDANAWDIVRRAFPDDCNGSRVIITSRHLDVASYADPSNYPHRLNLMNIDRSWNLLRKKVFGEGECHSELEEIGKFIAEKCEGLPLAIVVIAGILSKVDRIRENWERVARNVSRAVNTHYGNFTEILSLSYKHLPYHLRPCFLYIGTFPENYEINVSKLVKLWDAEGFLKSNKTKNVEDMAREYLEDLINRCLVSISKKKSNGQIKTIKIHDLLRDLCLRKAREEKFLRGISDFQFNLQDGILHSRYHLLRVLDASSQQLTSFPVQIRGLRWLRYLAITFTPYSNFEVPEWLSAFQCLQTLIILQHNFKLRLIDVHYLEPFRIWEFPKLQHLILFNFYISDPATRTLTALKNLHTLAHVISFTCSENVLKLVPNVKKLKISYMPGNLSKAGWSKYRLYNLVRFHVLEKLNLHVIQKFLKNTIPSQNFRFPALRKFNIAFPGTLKKLTLSCCRLPWSDMTLIGSLPNLEVLKLKIDACCGDAWETSEGQFCQLKALLIEGSDPQHWETESSHFPCLQQLHLDHCQRLSEIPCCIGDIPTLQLMCLDYCSESLETSAMSIKEEQHENGNDDIEVHIRRSAISVLATTPGSITEEE